ncbi:MAG: hypothetical protein NTW04_06140 [Elusimicrobia bacterium]|nr:hypothetical protein [Elusimicrobiota bacterium]
MKSLAVLLAMLISFAVCAQSAPPPGFSNVDDMENISDSLGPIGSFFCKVIVTPHSPFENPVEYPKKLPVDETYFIKVGEGENCRSIKIRIDTGVIERGKRKPMFNYTLFAEMSTECVAENLAKYSKMFEPDSTVPFGQYSPSVGRVELNGYKTFDEVEYHITCSPEKMR